MDSALVRNAETTGSTMQISCNAIIPQAASTNPLPRSSPLLRLTSRHAKAPHQTDANAPRPVHARKLNAKAEIAQPDVIRAGRRCPWSLVGGVTSGLDRDGPESARGFGNAHRTGPALAGRIDPSWLQMDDGAAGASAFWTARVPSRFGYPRRKRQRAAAVHNLAASPSALGQNIFRCPSTRQKDAPASPGRMTFPSLRRRFPSLLGALQCPRKVLRGSA